MELLISTTGNEIEISAVRKTAVEDQPVMAGGFSGALSLF